MSKGDTRFLLLATLAAMAFAIVSGGKRALPQARAAGAGAGARTREKPYRESRHPDLQRLDPTGILGDAGRGGDAGHRAARPQDIPARGWWAIVKRVGQQFNDHRLMTEAAGLTFYALLALFPALAALVSMYGLFSDPASISQQLDAISGIVPGGGMDIINDQVHRLTATSNQALGFGLVVGLATSLWSANQGIKSIFDALNVVYDEHEKRSYIYRTFLSLLFTLGTLLFLIVAMIAVVALPVALNFVGLGGDSDLLLLLARWPVLLLAVSVYLSFVYRFGPSREYAQWLWVSWGSAFAAVVWVAGSIGFSWYVANFGSYNKTYGSLGAVVGFMTWIWISGMIVLTGAEVNAEMEHQTAHDTTTGPARPLGARGARKADTVAHGA